ncbi:MAG TPA: endonuclease/exonuclease/phosphatase family protein [Rectinemataceae bacterium]
MRDCAATDPRTGERLSFHTLIAEAIAALKPEIALFQEIQEDDEKGGDIALLSAALAKAGWAMPYLATVETGGQDDLAIFSRLPLSAQGSVLEPRSADPWPRPGQKAIVDWGSKRLIVYNLHLKAMSDAESERARKAQAAALAAVILGSGAEGLKESYILIGGDFNTTNPGDRDSPGSTLGLMAMKADTDPGNDFSDPVEELRPQVPTFVDTRYRSILDHILLSPAAARALVPGSLRIVEDLPKAGAIPLSDHRPVLVDLASAPHTPKP